MVGPSPSSGEEKAPMSATEKSSLGYASRWLPLVFAAIAVTSLFLLVLVQPESVNGSVLRVREGSVGVFYATVEYLDPRGDQPGPVVEELQLPPGYEGRDVVPIWLGPEDVPSRIGLFGQIEITPALVLAIAGLAALLGGVVQMTVRGYGYVRGTSEYGQTNPVEVAEDRGFYWRT